MISLREKYANKATVCNDLDRKIAFLEEYYQSFKEKPKTFRNSVDLIEKMGEYENIFKCDFAEFRYNEVSSAFSSLSWTGVAGTFGVKSAFFKKYVTWCYDNGYINSEQFKSHPIFSYRFEDGKNAVRFKKENFKDFDDFYEYLEEVFEIDVTGNDIDPNKSLIKKTFLYLAWMGLDTEEIRHLSANEVDLKKKTVLLKEKGISAIIPDKRIVSALRDVMEITKLMFIGKKGVKYYRAIKETNMVIKNTQMKDGMVSGRFCTDILDQLKKRSLELPSTHRFYGKTPSFHSISRNGLFCRLYQEEQKLGRNITAYDRDILSKVFYSPIDNKTQIYFLSNYENWKELRDTLR